MTNRILIKLYVPILEKEFDIWVPSNRKTYKVIMLIVKSLYELSGYYYKPSVLPMLWDKYTAKQYDINLTIKENNIKNGMEIILL